jgi:hypothetical protein
MSDIQKLRDARSGISTYCYVQTFKGPGDQRVLSLSPAGWIRQFVLDYASTHDNMAPISNGTVLIYAYDANDAASALTELSRAITYRGDNRHSGFRDWRLADPVDLDVWAVGEYRHHGGRHCLQTPAGRFVTSGQGLGLDAECGSTHDDIDKVVS